MDSIIVYEKAKEYADSVVGDLAQKIQPAGLNSIIVGVADFANDPIVISKGGLDEYARRITT